MKEQAEQIEQMLHKLSEQIGEAEAKPGKETQGMYG
jgi:predicted ATP-grasp superfamily ATP-dependent carboligase